MVDVGKTIYDDFKKVLKYSAIVIISLLLLCALYAGYVYFSDKYSKSRRESSILNQAIPFTKSHTPMTFIRDDFGNRSELKIWFFGDTDQHAVVSFDNKYAVYTSSISKYGTLEFNRVAGDICGYVDGDISGKNITTLSCDSKIFNGGPWNNK